MRNSYAIVAAALAVAVVILAASFTVEAKECPANARNASFGTLARRHHSDWKDGDWYPPLRATTRLRRRHSRQPCQPRVPLGVSVSSLIEKGGTCEQSGNCYRRR